MSELSWWYAPHPAWEQGEDWPQEVPVVRYETDDEVALIDPFLPPGDSFDPRGKPVRVLLTQPAHYRGTADFVQRFGASVWVPPRAQWRKRPNPATTDELPPGVEAIELDGEPQQVVFFVLQHATLVTGDVLSGTTGVLRVFVDEADPVRLLPALDRLAELPIERVVIPHGDVVPENGAAHIRLAVAIESARLAQPPAGVRTRIVAVDGHGGAGKSTLAAHLARELDAQVLHTDDFASWDNPIDWWPGLVAQALEPLAAGEPARFTPTSWGGPPKDDVVVEPGGTVILEGVTASREAFRPFLSFAIWVETPRELCLRRGLERDGGDMQEQWDDWMSAEDAYIERERPAEHADVVLPGDQDLWS